MLYFFGPDIKDIQKRFDLNPTECHTHTFRRFYINSDLCIEVRLGKAYLGEAYLGGDPIPGSMVEMLRPETKVFMKGRVWIGDNYRFFRIYKPWRVAVLDTPQKIAGLIPYLGKLPDYFYRRKVGLFGGPGSGKSCLARELTNTMCIDHGISADNPYEYASTFIARYGAPTFDDQIWIFLKQWEREEDISNCKQMMISDCPHPLTYMYTRLLAQSENRGTDKTIPWLHQMALKGLDSFETKILLPFKAERCTEDGIRIHNSKQSKEITDRIQHFLSESGCSYITHDGDVGDLARKILQLNK